MKTFKQYITEAPVDDWDISWKRKFIEHIIEGYDFLYLPPKTVKDIMGTVEVETFHGTGIEGLKRLKSIQHTRKTISSFSKLGHSTDVLTRKFSGDYKEDIRYYDVLCKMSGHLIIGGSDDIMSLPDEKGVRGIESQGPMYEIRDYSQRKDNMLRTVFKTFFDDNPELSKFKKERYTNSFYELQKAYKSESTDKKTKKLISRFFHTIMKEYYHFNRNYLIEKKDIIAKNYFSTAHRTSSWNEILISNFTIKEILIICTSKKRRELVLDGITKLGLKNKCVNFGEWAEESENYMETSSYHNIETEERYKNLRNRVREFIGHSENNYSAPPSETEDDDSW